MTQIEIRVNGKQRAIDAGLTLRQLVDEMQLDARYLVVEWNGEAMSYAEAAQSPLRAGDRLELVRPVAGG